MPATDKMAMKFKFGEGAAQTVTFKGQEVDDQGDKVAISHKTAAQHKTRHKTGLIIGFL